MIEQASKEAQRIQARRPLSREDYAALDSIVGCTDLDREGAWEEARQAAQKYRS
jgi:hypothetical protein